ncbi:MAG: hypothetical protein J2P35_09305 [Actinobacteria bacterium]|nr:hypothetical protein [Actinomycetota bacterium]MBO0789180.1 hypothetical protein [Actinomycetota bacterium]
MAPAAAAQAQGGAPFVGPFHKTTKIASTVPANGDVNPYGTVVVRASHGRLHKGSVIVSNFNDKQNLQGTGSTIVQISPGGKQTLFAHIGKAKLPGPCPGGIGLTTALTVLPGGWVVVGSLPTTNGMAATASAGCLLVLDNQGNVRETITGHGINGPWDMTASSSGDHAALFVTNVLNGTVAAHGKVAHLGTVLRLDLHLSGTMPPKLSSITTVGSGFSERTDPSALVIGPTGVGLGRGGTLYVANSLGNRINAIPDALFRTTSAGKGQVITGSGALSTPLGLTIAPDGDILTVNAGNGELVETTPSGHQVATRTLDSSGTPPGAGALFGLAVAPRGAGVYYVDDAVNTLRLLH